MRWQTGAGPAGRWPQPHEVVFVGRAASVQFGAGNAFRFRIIRVVEQSAFPGWVWSDGFQLGPDGAAVARREIFVLASGLGAGTPVAGTSDTEINSDRSYGDGHV